MTNDNLVNFLGAVLGYLALRFIMSPSLGKMAFVGATFGLLVATKLSALPMGLVIVVLVLLVPTWKRRLSLLAVAGGGAALTCGWYLIQNTVRYGDPLARTASSRYLALNGGLGTLLAPYRVKDPLRYVFWNVPQTIMRTFWYESGWNQFTWKMPVYVAITVVVLVVLVGIYGQKIPRDVLITLVASLARRSAQRLDSGVSDRLVQRSLCTRWLRRHRRADCLCSTAMEVARAVPASRSRCRRDVRRDPVQCSECPLDLAGVPTSGPVY